MPFSYNSVLTPKAQFAANQTPAAPTPDPAISNAGAATPRTQFAQRAAASAPPPAPPVQAPAQPTTYTTPSGAQVTGDGKMTSGPTNTPVADPQADYKSAFGTYMESLKGSPDAKAAKDYLSTLITNSKLANEKALDSGETLGFATGEAQRVGRNNSLAIEAATGAYDKLSGNDKNMSDAAKARADYEKSLLDSNKPFDLSAGQTRFTLNPKTRKYEEVATGAAKHSSAYTEWQDAVTNGYTGSFNEYQNVDANRKIPLPKITSAGGKRIVVNARTGTTIKDLGSSSTKTSGGTDWSSLLGK